MPSKTPGPKSEHRVASYNKGCRCETCCRAKRDAIRLIRQGRRERQDLPLVWECPYCSFKFATKRGMTVHKTFIHE